MKKDSSWGHVANWYNEVVTGKGSYQRDLILPNLLRLMDIKRGEVVLDLACGQGFFAGNFAKAGARVFASDISPELISIAKSNKENSGVDFFISPAENISFIENDKLDKVIIVLAIQNIEKVAPVFSEIQRILKPGGKLYLVLNHPAFRIPKETFWGYDDEKDIQFRMVYRYMSEMKVEIDMTPGEVADKKKTLSFHRPLQYYFKILKNNGFYVVTLEEWISGKISEEGPRKKAEDRARKEFPMFMAIECVKK